MIRDRYIKIIHKLVQFLLSLPYFSGRDFLTEKIPQLFLFKGKGSIIIPTVYGFSINVNPECDKGVDTEIFLNGAYELGTAHILTNILDDGASFIDVGANIGFFSLLASKIVAASGRVYSFEPFPESLELLKENIKLNGIDNILVYDVALGSANSQMQIYPEKENRGGSSLIRNEHSMEDGAHMVSVKPLNDIAEISNDKNIRAIKIDVEGWELEVLRGCSALLNSANPPVIILEYSSYSVHNPKKMLELIDHLRSLDKYNVYKLKRGKGRVSKLMLIESNDQLPDHDNLFCFTSHHLGNISKSLFEKHND